jgi:hypothetical protein
LVGRHRFVPLCVSRERVRFWRKGLLRDALLSLAAIELGSAWCAEIAPVRFDIPAQNLEVALDEFSRQSGIVGLYDGRMVAHQSSSAVHGTLKPEDALAALLRDTQLTAEFTSRASFVVVYRDKATTLAGNSVEIGQVALATIPRNAAFLAYCSRQSKPCSARTR